jgi:hypothetical protein
VTTLQLPWSMIQSFTQLWPGPPGLQVQRIWQRMPCAERSVASSRNTGAALKNCVISST